MSRGFLRLAFMAGAAAVGTLVFRLSEEVKNAPDVPEPDQQSAMAYLEPKQASPKASGAQTKKTAASKDVYELHRNAAKGRVDRVKALLVKGVPVDARGERHRTALMYAAWNGQIAVCDFLLLHGANSRLEDYDGTRAVGYAAGRGQIQTVQALLERQSQKDANRDLEYAKLIYIAYTGDVSGLNAMEGKLVTINRINPEGQTPLHIAAGNGYVLLVEALIGRGADAARANYLRQTPLHWASWNRQVEVVKLLLSRGVSPASKSIGGTTPLMLAAQSNDAGIVRLLLEKGASPDERDNDGRSAISIAESMGHRDVVALLRDYSKAR